MVYKIGYDCLVPLLQLLDPTFVDRSADHTWVGASEPYESLGYVPGDTSFYLRLQIVPATPLPSLPSTLNLLIVANTTPNTDTSAQCADDTVQTGDDTAPSGSNQAIDTPVGGSRAYILDLPLGTTLADFNAGLVYLWLGYTSPPTSYNPADYSFGYGGTGTHDDDGSITAWAGAPPFAVDTGNGTPVPSHAEENGTLEVTASGPGSFCLATVTVHSTAQGAAVGSPGTTSCRALVTDGYGGSDDVTGDGAAVDVSTARKVRISLSGGSGTTTVAAMARSEANVAPGTSRCKASTTVSAVGSAFDACDLSLDLLQLGYLGDGGDDTLPFTRLSGKPPPKDELEMTTMYIGDLLTFWAQFSDPSTGEAIDPDSTPAYRIYEEATDTPIQTGTLARQDDSNTVGFYRAQKTLSLVNGFEVGKCYAVRVTADVLAVNQAGVVERFVVRAPLLTALDVWAYIPRTLTTPSDPTSLLPVTAADALPQIRRGDSWSVSLTGLGNLTGRTKLWLTIKAPSDVPLSGDSKAMVQIEETADLIYLNRAAPGTGQTGTLVVDDAAAGDITLTLSALATAALPPGSFIYDVQMLAGSVITLVQGPAPIVADITRATS